MEERDHVEDHVLFPEPERDLRVHGVEVELTVGERDALRQARGAARVEELGGRVLVDLRVARFRRAARQERLVLVAGDAAGLAFQDHEARSRRELRDDRLHERQEVAVECHQLGTGVVEDVGDLVRGEPDVDRVQHRSGLQDAVVGLQEVVRVVGDERHSIAGLDPQPVQRVRQPMRALRIGAVRELLLAIDDADLVAEVGRCPVAELQDRERHEHREPPCWTGRHRRRQVSRTGRGPSRNGRHDPEARSGPIPARFPRDPRGFRARLVVIGQLKWYNPGDET
jgi:hypothetical protein